MNILNFILFSLLLQCSKTLSKNQLCSQQKSSSCPCHGFESYCQFETGYTILNFPKSGSFVVQNLDNTKREIQLFDPDRCIAKKMMPINLTSTPFQYKSNYNQFYMVYKCFIKRDDDNVIRNNSDVHVINCLSSDSYTVVSAPWNYTMPSCEVVNGGGRAVVLPVDYEHGIEPLSLVLTWSPDSPCIPQLACPTDFGRPSTRSWIIKATIALSLGIPGLLCITWCLARILAMWRASTTTNTRVVTVNPHPSPPIARPNLDPIGLDQPTLDSYPIMVIGESGRFLNSSNQDKICPICLVDYQSKDTLKILPECLHKFHVDCIDEWLRAKAMCPICRAMPPRSFV